MKLLTTKLLFFLNHVGVLLYVCVFLSAGFLTGSAGQNPSAVVPLILSALILGDIVYISFRNIKGSRILTLFCALLALDGWYILLAPEPRYMFSLLFLILGPVIGYLSARFLLYFYFRAADTGSGKQQGFSLHFSPVRLSLDFFSPGVPTAFCTGSSSAAPWQSLSSCCSFTERGYCLY